MADVVFILGAGCSVHAGAPVMADFLDRSRELFFAGEVDDKREEFLRTFDVISDLQRVHSKAKLDHNNIEAVFSAVDLARTLRKLPGRQPEEIEQSLKALVWLIVRTLEKSIKFKTRGGQMVGTSEYVQLAGLLLKLYERQPPLTAAVLTFNYDICADVSFAAERLAFTYGLNGEQRGVPLLKLHGSLNWGRSRREDRGIVPYDIGTYISSYRMNGYFPGAGASPDCSTDISSHMAKELRNKLQDVENEPVLVPPTWSKGEYHRAIGAVWARAAKELESARYIYILGYSLPETDQFFRLLFALGTEGRVILSKVRVFNPNHDSVEQRFRELLGQAALDRFSVHGVTFHQGLSFIEEELITPQTRRH